MVSRANVPPTMASATQLTAPEQRELEWESRWEQWKLESDARWEKRKLELQQQSDARWERSMQQLRNMIFPKPIGEVTVADKESSFASPVEEVDLLYEARRQQSEALFHERRADTDPQTFIPLPQVEGLGFDSLVSHDGGLDVHQTMATADLDSSSRESDEGEPQPVSSTTLVQTDGSLENQREEMVNSTDLQSYILSSYQKLTSCLAVEISDAKLETIIGKESEGIEFEFSDSQQLKKAVSLPTARPNALVRELDVISPISVYYCVPLWMFIWYPKPMVKMKLEEVAQEVWSHDSLKARNIKLSTKHGCLVSNRSTMEVKQELHKEQMSYANFSMIDNTWKERKDEMVKKFDGLSKVVKDVLSDKVEKVIVSDRVEDFPCCLVVRECRWTDNMERIVKAYSSMADSSMAWCISSTKTMELNPEKPMEELRKRADSLKKRVHLGSFYQNFMGLVTKVKEVIMVSLVMKMKFLTSLANWVFDGGGFNRAIYIDALVEDALLTATPNLECSLYECVILQLYNMLLVGDSWELVDESMVVGRESVMSVKNALAKLGKEWGKSRRFVLQFDTDVKGEGSADRKEAYGAKSGANWALQILTTPTVNGSTYRLLEWLLVWVPKPSVKMRLGKDDSIQGFLWVPFPDAYVLYFLGDILLRDREANLNLQLEYATAWMQNQLVAQWVVHWVHSLLAGATWEFSEEIKVVCFPGFIEDDEA